MRRIEIVVCFHLFCLCFLIRSIEFRSINSIASKWVFQLSWHFGLEFYSWVVAVCRRLRWFLLHRAGSTKAKVTVDGKCRFCLCCRLFILPVNIKLEGGGALHQFHVLSLTEIDLFNRCLLFGVVVIQDQKWFTFSEFETVVWPERVHISDAVINLTCEQKENQ